MNAELKVKFQTEAAKEAELDMWFKYITEIITPEIEAKFIADEKKTLKGYYDYIKSYAKKNAKNGSFCGDSKLALKLLCDYAGVKENAVNQQTGAGRVELDVLDLLGG